MQTGTLSTEATAIRVVIADDHELMREGVKKILRRRTEMQVVGEAADAAQLMELIGRNQADVVILDIDLPGRSGLDALAEIRNRWPGAAVVVLSMYPEERFAMRALKAGASAYVSKASAADELVRAVTSAAQGRRYITPAVAELLARELESPSLPPVLEKLSGRESQILSLIAAGKSAKQIGAELAISYNTVQTYRARILEKLRMRSNAELIRYAIEQGLIR